MAGSIWFLQRHWLSSGAAVEYVMQFLASRVHDPSTTAWLTELVEANVVSGLDLSDPSRAELVDIIADQLPSHVAGLDDEKLRDYLTKILEDLYRFAREQQDYNRDPTQDTYFTIGPNPAKYFDIDNLMRGIPDYLNEVDYVRIDVSDYTPEQRAVVRKYVAELKNPRIIIVGDD
ncbi:hypothetical protein ACX9NE_12230 [Mycobacterium sp. ML4]